MSRPEILNRSPVEILLDDRWADVRGPCHGRGVSKPLADAPHYVCHNALGLGVRLGDSVLRQRDRGGQSPAPRPEVLGGELLAHVLADVIVEDCTRERAGLSIRAVAEESRTAGPREQLLD